MPESAELFSITNFPEMVGQIIDQRLVDEGYPSLEYQTLPVTLALVDEQGQFVILRADRHTVGGHLLIDAWFSDQTNQPQEYCMAVPGALFAYRYGPESQWYKQANERTGEFTDRLKVFADKQVATTIHAVDTKPESQPSARAKRGLLGLILRRP